MIKIENSAAEKTTMKDLEFLASGLVKQALEKIDRKRQQKLNLHQLF
jgi:hypothetical protein